MALIRHCLAWILLGGMVAVLPGAAQAQPTFSSSLDPSTIGPGSVTTLEYSIENFAGTPALDAAVTTVLPAGVTIASDLSATLSTECVGGVLTAPSGGATFSLSDTDIGAGNTCTLSIPITSSTVGTATITSGDLTSSQGNSGPTTDTLTVNGTAPGFSKVLDPDTIAINGTTRLRYTVDNSAGSTFYFNGFFQEFLPNGIALASNPNITTSAGCLSVNTSLSSGSTISLNGIAIASGQICEIGFDIRATTSGSYDLLSENLSNGTTNSGRSLDRLTVSTLPQTVPQLQKFFVSGPANPGGTATLEFIVSNGTPSAATDIAFTDDLDAMLSGATLIPGSIPTNSCGAGSAISGSGVISFTGGELSSRDSCSFQVGVRVPATATGGDYTNTTSALTATQNGSPVTGSAASDTLTVNSATVSEPVFTKEFIDDPVGPGGDVTVRYTIDNTSTTSGLTDLAFTDTFDFISVTPVSGAGAVCGGNVSVIAGTDFNPLQVILGSGSASAGGSCTFDVVLNVDGSEGTGTYTSTTSALSYNDGDSIETAPAASDTLLVGGTDLSFTKAFGQAIAQGGDTVSLTFTIENDAESLASASSIAFSDDLEAFFSGTVLDQVTADTCGGTGTGTGVFSYSGGTLAVGASCEITIDVILGGGSPNGDVTNTTSALTATSAGLAAGAVAASDSLYIGDVDPLGVTFTASSPAIVGETVTFDVTLTNPNAVATSSISATLDIDNTLAGTSASSLPASGFCGAGSTASGTNFLIFSGMEVAVGSSCTFQFEAEVPGGSPDGDYGFQLITSSTISGANFSRVSNAEVLVNSAILTLDKTFAASSVNTGASVDMNFTLENTSASLTVTNIGFTDDLDAMLSGAMATGLPASGVCGAGSNLSGSSTVTLSGASLAPGQTCTFSVPVAIPASAPGGAANNVTSAVTGTALNTDDVSGLAAQASIIVTPALDLAFAKSFGTTTIGAGFSTDLSITIENQGFGAANNVGFTDDLNAMVTGATASGLGASAGCGGGTFTGTGLLVFSGGNIAAGATCTLTATVTVPASTAPGSYTNTTSALSVGGITTEAAVSAALTVAVPPLFTQDIGLATLPVNQVTPVVFTIDNGANGATVTDLDFSNTLPVNVTLATPANASTTCTGGTLTAASGGGLITYTGGSLAGGATCTVTADITSAIPGSYTNLTGALTSSFADSGTASDSVTFEPPPTFAKAFSPDAILLGETSTLTLTIDNSASTLAATALDFTDTLPAGMVVATPSNGATTCTGGALTAASGNGFASYSGGTVAAGATCTVSLDVTTTTSDVFLNTSGDLTSSAGNSGTASDTLTVTTPEIGVSGSIGGAVATAGTLDQGDQPAGTEQVLNVTVSNTGDANLTIDASPVISAASNVTLGTVTPPAGTTVAPAGSETFSIAYTPDAAGAFSFDVSLGNSDVDEDPYTFTVSGVGLDVTAPAGYTVSLDQNPVFGGNETAVSFTFAGAEVGATYDFTLTSDGGGPPVTGTGTVGSATEQVTGIDASGLGDGTLTLTAQLTDAASNTGLDATDTASKDATAPAGYTVAFDDDPVNAADAAATGFSFAGAEVGATFTYSIASDGGGTPVTGSGTITGATEQVTGLDLSGLGDGTLTVTAALTDSVGNTGLDATATVTKDTMAPVGYTVAFDNDPVNISNSTSTGFSFAGAEVGASYAFTITSDAGGTPVTGSGTITSATEQVSGLDLSGLADGTLTVTATLTDTAGNTGVDATGTATKDATAPSLDIDAPIAGDDVVNAAEAGAVTISGTATGLADGRTVTVGVADSATGSVGDSTTVSGGVWSVTLDLSALADGGLTITADAQDAAGNMAAQASATAAKDATAPAGYSVVFANNPLGLANVASTGFAFGGAEVGASYAFTITSDGGGTPVTGSGTIAGATEQVTGLDLTGLADGTLTVTATLTDTAGNTGVDATGTATKDATAPSLAIDAPVAGDDVANAAEAGAVTISGTATGLEDGQTVTVGVADSATGSVGDSTTVSGGVWSVTLDLSALADGGLSITADAQDAAGNMAAQASATAAKDATAPAGYSVAFDLDPVNIANQTAVSFSFGAAEVGTAYAFTITSDGGGTPVTGNGTITSATEQVSGLDLTGLADGTLTVSATLTDTAGNTGVDATGTATKDSGAPTVTLAGPTGAQADPFTVTATFSEDVAGFTLAGLTLSQGTASNLTGSGMAYSFTVTPDFDGTLDITADAGAAQDGAGNPSVVSDTITVVTDLTGTPNPTPPSDADSDGVPDNFESSALDRDGDGRPDAQDFDPQGYFYCEDDGRIIPGGGFTVSGPSGTNSGIGTANDIRITRDGSTGEIQWFAQRPGRYSIALTYPTAVGIPSTARTSAGTLDLTTLLPSNPAVIGSTEVGNTGFLADGSLAANPVFYTSFDIEAGDPFVLANNIPMTQCATNEVSPALTANGAEANGGVPTDVVFAVNQGRVSTQDTVVTYSIGGTATAGSDFTAPSGTVMIPAGDTSAQVTVTVLEDSAIEGAETLTLTLTAVTAGDLSTQLGATVTASATITDDDLANILVTDVDLTASENGDDTAAMDFSLLGAPTATVTLAFAGDAQCTVSPATISFTPANFGAVQRLTIRAIDDDDVEGAHSCQPTVAVSSPDARFDGLPLALSQVTVSDDLVDQVREPLTEILEENLEQTVRTQSRSFSRIAKGALARLQEGNDAGRCGVLSSFDVDGSLEIRDATGTAQGVFGRDVMNCANNVREILDGSFELAKTEDLGMTATLQFSLQRERFLSDTALQGYFVGGYFNRANVDGNGGEGRIDGYGLNGGLYGARGYASGVFVDYYLAGAMGHHRFDIDFDANPADINATGDYTYLAGFAGVGVSGQMDYDSFTMKPRVGLDWAYARAGDVDVTASQLGQTDTGVIELSDYNGLTATAEVIFESLVAPGGSDAMQAVTKTSIAPRLSCNLSSFDDDAECGVGIAFGWERIDTSNGLTYGIEVDVEHMNDTQRLLLDLRRERPFSRGQGAVVTRLFMPAGQDVTLEHGVRLDW